jgi:repressor LexA
MKKTGLQTRVRIMEFLKEYIAKKGYAPTFREIGDGCGIVSTSAVSAQLDNLEDSGHISRESWRSRTIVVKNPDLPTA